MATPSAREEAERPRSPSGKLRIEDAAATDLTRRPLGYELDDQTLSPVDSVALIAMRHPKDPKNGRVLDPSWTLKKNVN